MPLESLWPASSALPEMAPVGVAGESVRVGTLTVCAYATTAVAVALTNPFALATTVREPVGRPRISHAPLGADKPTAAAPLTTTATPPFAEGGRWATFNDTAPVSAPSGRKARAGAVAAPPAETVTWTVRVISSVEAAAAMT